MDLLSLPLFDDEHRSLSEAVQRLCDERLSPLAGTELEDQESAVIEYAALLGQEGMFDPVVGPALEGDPPKPDIRSMCLTRRALARTSGLADATYGAQALGMYPLALAGNEDQRAIYLPSMAAGQHVVALALIDAAPALSCVPVGEGYQLSGVKAMVPLAPIANRFVVLARHQGDGPPRFSLFVVGEGQVTVEPEGFVSPLPVGRVRLDVEVDEDARIGGEGQGLVIAQAALDVLRLPAAAACTGLAAQALDRGAAELLKRGVGGRPLKDQQGSQWQLADALIEVEASLAMLFQASWARDTSTSRENQATTAARHMAQTAAEDACTTVANLIGIRGLSQGHPWSRLIAEVRALRLEGEFLENPRTTLANAFLQSVEAAGNG